MVLDCATPIVLSRSESEIVNIENEFAFNLYKKAPVNLNFVVSPLSATMIMSVAANAATGEKQTEIINTLGFAGRDMDEVNALNKRLVSELQKIDNTIDIHFANALWLDEGVVASDDFKAKVENSFGMEFFSDKFGTPAFIGQVNSWVSEKTEGFIPQIISEQTGLEPALFVSALSFKGEWSMKFDKSLTEEKKFRNLDGDYSTPETMIAHNYPFKGVYDEKNGASWVCLPFGNYGYEMLLVVPDEELGLEKYFSNIDYADFLELTNPTSYESFSGTIQLPKFTLDGVGEIELYLSQLGMEKVFKSSYFNENGEYIRYSALPSEEFTLGNLNQSITFSVDEEGAAGAVVSYNDLDIAMPMRSKNVIVDHPFTYIIREHSTGAIILMGAITHLYK